MNYRKAAEEIKATRERRNRFKEEPLPTSRADIIWAIVVLVSALALPYAAISLITKLGGL